MQCLWKVPPSLVNIVPVVAVFSSMIPQYRSLTNLGNYSLCHRRHEINKKCNNYCLSALCHRQLNTARNMLARQLRRVGYCSLFPDDLSIKFLSQPPKRATRKQRTNKLGRCYQPERPCCTLARYWLPSKTAPFTHVFVRSSKSAGNARARWSLARRT